MIARICLGLIVCGFCVGRPSAIYSDEKRRPVGEVAAFDAPNEAVAEKKNGYRLNLPIPFNESDELRLKQQVQRIVDREGQLGRPLIAIEFVAKVADGGDAGKPGDGLGRGTEFERSLALARWLIGPNGVRARTVAYLPRSIEGHAVLVALACEEMAIDPSAEIGRAGIDEPQVDPLIVKGYLDVAARRGAFPAAAVQSMLQSDGGLYRVELPGEKTEFVDQAGVEKLRSEGKILNETQLSIPNQLGSFLGQEARTWQWINHVVRDESQLGEIFGIENWSSLKLKLDDGPIRPAVVDVRGAVGGANVNRWLRVVNEAIDLEQANVLILQIHSPGGSLDESLRLANYLADLDKEKIQTIAWVEGEARGDAALIALSADRLFMSPRAVLGGPGEATIDREAVVARRDEWQAMSKKVERTEGEVYSLLSPDLILHEFRHRNGPTELADEDVFIRRADFADWKKGKRVDFVNGLRAEQAVERRWAEGLAANAAALASEIGIDQLPEPKRVTPLEQWIRNLADQQWLAGLLLTLALSLFANEMTTPGIGVAGFMAMLCLLLFFWMRFLNGTVEWLEILLCVGGMFALGLELFVLPGFGIFGFGGAIMLIVGIVLAGQTFIVPANEYQWTKLAMSTGQIAVAMIGLFGTLYLLRNQLEHLPFVRLLKLDPPPKTTTTAEPSLDHLVGKRGTITARCSPIGSALIDDKIYEVHTAGLLLEPGIAVEVSEVRSQTICVRPAN